MPAAGGLISAVEFTCNLCLRLFYEPSSLSCGHTFCKGCLEHLAHHHSDQRTPLLCPSCRRPFTREQLTELAPNYLLSELIEKYCSRREIAEAREELRQELQERAESVRVKLVYGNTHADEIGDETGDSVESLLARRNRHYWEMFVECSARDDDVDESTIIERVEFELHPTFQPSTISVNAPPFVVRRRGWGVFDVQVTIYFNFDKPPLKLTHLLSFWGRGSQSELDFDVPRAELVSSDPPLAV